MLKQSAASRNQRYKGFKVKHVVQICAFLALCIWLLNQVDKAGTGIFQTAIKLGRKDLDHLGQSSTSSIENNNVVEAEDEEVELEDTKPDEIEDEHEPEKVEVEESEEVEEDLIDEEDRDKENQIEDLSLLEDQTMNEAEGDQNQDTTSVEQLQSILDTGIAAQIRRLKSADEMLNNNEQRVDEIVTIINKN